MKEINYACLYVSISYIYITYISVFHFFRNIVIIVPISCSEITPVHRALFHLV